MSFHYHPGERAVQRRAGVTGEADFGAEHSIRPEIPPVAAEFLAQQVMIVVGHRDTGGAVWASALSGVAGFARALDERTVRIDARPAAGDALAATLRDGPTALGMLAIEPETRRRMRFNGRGELREDGAVWLTTEQVYANCPKYISTRRHVEVGSVAEAPPVERPDALPDRLQHLIGNADSFFIATTHTQTGADASHRGGNPGFVQLEDDRHLTWPDYKGNSMFMTLGNLELDAHAGLLFPDWQTGAALQLTGTATSDWDPAHAARFPGAERLVHFAIDEVVVLPGALRWRWELEKYSRFSPPAPKPTRAPAHHE